MDYSLLFIKVDTMAELNRPSQLSVMPALVCVDDSSGDKDGGVSFVLKTTDLKSMMGALTRKFSQI